MGWLSNWFRQPDRTANERDEAPGGPQPVEHAPRAELSDPLSLLAMQSGERDEFLRRIVSDGVLILAIAPGGEVDANSPDELLGHIREQAQALSQDRFGTPFTYSRKGSTVLPVFSTMDASEAFIKCLRFSKVTPFQCLQVTAGFWAANSFDLTRVFFNPLSNAESELSESDLRRIRLLAQQSDNAR